MPWTRQIPIPGSDNTAEEKKIIEEVFEKRKPQTLCADLDQEFLAYLTHLKELEIDEDPDYDHLVQLLRIV